jgi:hypothetical protein
MSIPRRTALQIAAMTVASSTVSAWRDAHAAASPIPETASDPLVDLTLDFTGMLLFATDAKAVLPELGQVHALLVNSAKLTSGSYPPHLPTLKVRKSDVAKYDAADAEIGEELEFGLMGQDVSLRIDGKVPTAPVTCESSVKSPGNAPLKLTPPYDAPWSDIAFVADLSNILAKPTTIHPDFLASTLAADSKVATRVTLAGGSLMGAAPTCAWGRHVSWGYNAPVSERDSYRQVITDIVQFRPPKAKSIEIVLKKRGESATRTITLKPVAVQVKIQNVIDGPLDCENPAHCTPGTAGCMPHHFRAYYELLKGPPEHFSTPGVPFLAGSNAQLANTDPPVYCPPPRATHGG